MDREHQLAYKVQCTILECSRICPMILAVMKECAFMRVGPSPSFPVGRLNHYSYTPHEHPCHIMPSLRRLSSPRDAAQVLQTMLATPTSSECG
jgi:hypothetical protein